MGQALLRPKATWLTPQTRSWTAIVCAIGKRFCLFPRLNDQPKFLSNRLSDWKTNISANLERGSCAKCLKEAFDILCSDVAAHPPSRSSFKGRKIRTAGVNVGLRSGDVAAGTGLVPCEPLQDRRVEFRNAIDNSSDELAQG